MKKLKGKLVAVAVVVIATSMLFACKKDKVAVEGITVTPTEKQIAVGESFAIVAEIVPSNALNKEIKWNSTNESVATVDANGTVTGVKEGVATITVTTKEGGKTATCKITVTKEGEAPNSLYIRLSTNKKSGEKIKLKIGADEADREKIWIDLNGNGTQESGEEKVEFDVSKEYTLGSQTVTIYGKTTFLDCSSNEINNLETKGNKFLATLHAYINPIQEVDVTQNVELKVLGLSNCLLSNIDVTQNVELTSLNCGNSTISKLDITNNTKLTYLEITRTKIDSIDLSRNTELTTLQCFRSLITKLDLTHNKKLKDIDCSRNKLESLDFSQNSELESVRCYFNKLTELNFSANPKLKYLAFSANKISGQKMTDLINSLNNRAGMSPKGDFRPIVQDTAEQNVCTVDQVNMLTPKNWEAKNFNGQESYPGS